MNGLRLAGQLLLWAGFISAALAATCQREFDFLPDDERAVLNQLPGNVADDDGERGTLHLNADELKSITTEKISELPVAELENVIDQVVAVSNQHQAEIDKEEEAAEERKNAGIPEPEEPEEPEVENAPPKSKKLDTLYFEKQRTINIEKKWPTVRWLWYGLSMALGLAGVALLRSTAKSADQDSGRVEAEYSTITNSLAELNERVAKLGGSLDTMKPAEVVQYIDDRCAEPFADFADARNALVQRFGLQAFAEIMTQFASAERFVNRAWSASADGYMNEARDCVTRATTHLKEASSLLNKYETK